MADKRVVYVEDTYGVAFHREVISRLERGLV